MVRTVIEDLAEVDLEGTETSADGDLWAAANAQLLGIVASAGTTTNPGASDED